VLPSLAVAAVKSASGKGGGGGGARPSVPSSSPPADTMEACVLSAVTLSDTVLCVLLRPRGPVGCELDPYWHLPMQSALATASASGLLRSLSTAVDVGTVRCVSVGTSRIPMMPTASGTSAPAVRVTSGDVARSLMPATHHSPSPPSPPSPLVPALTARCRSVPS
jgi:hypothetical protein